MSPSRMCSTAPVVTSATSAALTGVQAIPAARQAAAVLLVQACMSSSLIAATREVGREHGPAMPAWQWAAIRRMIHGGSSVAPINLRILAPGRRGRFARSPRAAARDISFQGKTITMIVGCEPGGGTDAFARLGATFLARELPGGPTVVV